MDNRCEYDVHGSVPTISHLLSLVNDVSRGYLWQRDPFQLTVVSDVCLRGVSYFDDAIVDEWFIVYLLVQISHTFPDLCISITDNDGQFLLIEAAHYLPRWADDPDIMDGRVWLRGGLLHLISPSQLPDASISQVLAQLSDSERRLQCQASDEIQRAISSCIDRFPGDLASNIHWCRVIIPRKLAYILNKCPQMVSHCIRAFKSRDSSSTRCYYQPSTSIVYACEMTRYQYASLRNDRYSPPRRSWLQIKELDQIWSSPARFRREFKWLQMGAMISAGFEILRADSDGVKCENLEVSQCASSFGGVAYPVDPCVNLDEADLQENYVSSQEFENVILAKTESLLATDIPLDDDSWMDITTNDLDRLLAERSGNVHVSTPITEQDFSNVASKLEEFMSGKEEASASSDTDETDGECDDVDPEIVKIMELMDSELFGKHMSEGDRLPDSSDKAELLKNLLESFSAQEGRAGPVQTMLNSMGFNLPRDDRESDSENEEER